MSEADAAPLRAAVSMLDVPVEDVWIDYMGLGGDLPLATLTDAIGGGVDLTDQDYDRLVHAINERFAERQGDHPLHYAEGRALRSPGR